MKFKMKMVWMNVKCLIDKNIINNEMLVNSWSYLITTLMSFVEKEIFYWDVWLDSKTIIKMMTWNNGSFISYFL